MRVVFFGTPAFAVPSLQALLDGGHDVAAVVTQPDRPQGRSRSTLVPPPVKTAALAAGVPVVQPERPRGDAFLAWLRGLEADLGVVAAYGHLLRPEVLAAPRLGMVNVHASLLPRWRGAAPIEWAIHAGDRETGISIMRMEAGLDSGPVYLRRATPISDDDTAATVTARLAALGAAALLEALPAVARGDAPEPQDPAGVTLAPKRDRATARVDWSREARAVSAHVRAFDPWPGAWTTLGAAEVKLFGGREDGTAGGRVGGTPGEVLATTPELLVACGEGAVRIAEVQPAGKTRMAARDWANGGGVRAGERFA